MRVSICSLFAVTACAVGLGAASAGAAPDKPAHVDAPRVESDVKSGKNWLLWGRDWTAQRHSPLASIDVGNVGGLGLAWAADIDSPFGLSGEPIVVDGVIYLGGALDRVYALDSKTGALLWQFEPNIEFIDVQGVSWTTRVNRGVAVWKGRVYVGTGDCRLVALDAGTGEVAWESRVCDPKEGVGGGITGAPRVGDDKVFIGYAGSEFAKRGSIVAFDANTGAERWRFWTVPGDPAKGGYENAAMEMAAKTWTDGWAKSGGGAVYDAITYDPETDLVYFGTGSAIPHNARVRDPKGLDNLFTSSIVAVKADTGEYVWHYQTTPFDAWDYDATWHLMIAELPISGEKRRVVMQAPKNGFFYVLDARSGELLAADPFVKVTWASHVDLETGRPVENPEARYHETAKGGEKVLVYPSVSGGHNWQSMAFSPQTGFVYLPVSDMPSYYAIGDDGQGWYEGHGVGPDDVVPEGAIPEKPGRLLAWDPVRRKAAWSVHQALDHNGGVLSTAGGLVFQGTSEGDFVAYSADRGKELWRYATGSSTLAAPVTYDQDGTQVVLLPVGQSAGLSLNIANRVTALRARGPARLLAFKHGGMAKLPESEAIVMPKPPKRTAKPATVAKGKKKWKEYSCDSCHGTYAVGIGRRALGGGAPDLRYAPASVHVEWHSIVVGGSRRQKGMPFQSISVEESEALHAFVIEQAWKEYEVQQSAKAD